MKYEMIDSVVVIQINNGDEVRDVLTVGHLIIDMSGVQIMSKF